MFFSIRIFAETSESFRWTLVKFLQHKKVHIKICSNANEMLFIMNALVYLKFENLKKIYRLRNNMKTCEHISNAMSVLNHVIDSILFWNCISYNSLCLESILYTFSQRNVSRFIFRESLRWERVSCLNIISMLTWTPPFVSANQTRFHFTGLCYIRFKVSENKD